MLSLFLHTDKELLQRISEDDSMAFTTLYRRYWEDMFLTATKALRDNTEACDVVQDVFLSLWNRRHELSIEGPLINYLQTAVRYKVIHYIQKNITRRDYLALLADVSVNWLPPDAEINLQLEELQKALSSVVTKMPPKMQQVYILSRREQLSHKEIAEQMSVSVETVKKHIQHALQLIKTALRHALIFISLLLSHLS